MNKFGLLDDEELPSRSNISDKIALFSAVKPRPDVDLAAIDAAATPHGFVSREVTDFSPLSWNGRRRRAIPSEPTRHLAIRLPSSSYDRFVAYADLHRLTYSEALLRLMDVASD